MSNEILKCPKCNRYTMHEICPKCNEKSISIIPAKYSPEDNYGKYRRETKKPELESKGLL